MTKEERQAIENVKQAIRELPDGVVISTDELAGTVEFWRKVSETEHTHLSVLRCKGKVFPFPV